MLLGPGQVGHSPILLQHSRYCLLLVRRGIELCKIIRITLYRDQYTQKIHEQENSGKVSGK